MQQDVRPPGAARSAAMLLAAISSIALVGGALYVAGFGVFDDTYVRVGGLALGAVLLLLLAFAGHGWRLRVADVALIALLGAATWQYFSVADELRTGLYELTTLDMVLGLGGLLALMELARRVIGTPLVIVCVLAAAYALLGRYLPVGGHAGVAPSEFLLTVWYSFDGVFGRPTAVVATTILVYIVFGAVLEGLGIGDVLLKFAVRLTGRLRGGSAHAAIVASALFGSISGSAVANVVGTGVITIPMIKRSGFRPAFAGAVEAAASSGGQIMPPVMGAVAFIMADVTGLPYLHVCIAALIPALLYYGGLFACVAVEARRAGIEPPRREDLPTITPHDWVLSLAFLVPLGLIIVLLVRGVSPALAGFWAVIAGLVLGIALNPAVAHQPARLWDVLRRAAAGSAHILVAVGAVGLIIAVMNMTGLGLQFVALIDRVAEGSLALSLVLMALGCLVLGMGMPTVPAYLIIILIMGPAVAAMGVPTVAAHMFVVYFAALSAVTPPVALAAFAAAPIAGANPIRVGAVATRLALVGFLVPFVFAYEPSMLIIAGFSVTGFVWSLVQLTAAGVLIAALSGRSRLLTTGGTALAIAAASPFLPAQVVGVAAAVAVLARLTWRGGTPATTKSVPKTVI